VSYLSFPASQPHRIRLVGQNLRQVGATFPRLPIRSRPRCGLNVVNFIGSKMNHYIINGIKYVPENTEPVKRKRFKMWMESGNITIQDHTGHKFCVGFFGYHHPEDCNITEIFDGEMIVSKDILMKGLLMQTNRKMYPIESFCEQLIKDLETLK